MILKSKNLPFYAFIIAFFLIMIGPYLLSHGMFMDGIIYATVSNNLANGVGSMSDLAFTETIELHFREHPPLAFWIQSVFYKVFGDSYVIEKLYSALTYVITGLIIRKIWLLISDRKQLAWLPLLFWISIPIITQAARNNLLENTMMVFTSTALYFLLKENRTQITNIVIAGFMIYLGFMTKGFVALFIWSFPFWHFVFMRKTSLKTMLKHTILLILFTILPFVIVSLIYPASFVYMTEYFQIQVANSLKNVQTVDSRFWIISKLSKELITPGILFIFLYFLSKITNTNIQKSGNNRMAYAIIAVALSGVFPIIISLKQSGFYFIPSLALISIGFGLLVETTVDNLYQKLQINQIGFKIFRTITVVSVFVALFIIFNKAGSNGRDHDKLNDLALVAGVTGKGIILEVDPKVKKDWASLSYLYRYYQISVEPTAKPVGRFFLSIENLAIDQAYQPVSEIDLSYFKLYKNE